jgi:hypothetical protein
VLKWTIVATIESSKMLFAIVRIISTAAAASSRAVFALQLIHYLHADIFQRSLVAILNSRLQSLQFLGTFAIFV